MPVTHRANVKTSRKKPLVKKKPRAPVRRASIARVPHVETKFFDSVVTDSPVLVAGTVQTSLVIIPQGTTESQRIGRKLRITSIHFRGVVALPNTAVGANSNDVCRVILLQDKQVNGATFAVLDYLETAEIHSFRNLANVNRFIALWDAQFKASANAGGGNGSTNFTSFERIPIEWHRDVNIPVEYNNTATTGVISTQTSNGLSFLFVSEAGVCNISGIFRVRFTDGG